MTVYLVMYYVEYEDDWPEGIFSTKEKAEEYLRNDGFAPATEVGREDEVRKSDDWVIVNQNGNHWEDTCACIEQFEVDP